MLFNPFEEELHLPATTVQVGDGERRQVEIIGEKDEQLVMFGIIEFYASHVDRVILIGLFPGQDDRLVAPQASRLVDRMRIDSPILEVGLGARDEEGLRLMQDIESGEVDIAPIHDIEAACLEGHLVEDVHIVQLAIRNMDEGRNIAPQIEERMEFDCTFVCAKARPGKERQTQVDSRRIEGIDRMLQLDAEAVLGVELAGRLDQAEGEVLVNAPVARLVGVGQGAAGDATTNAQVIELGGMRAQAGLDVAQAFPVGQLREGHAQELIEVREAECRVATGILLHAASKSVQRQMIHQLGEHQLSSMHGDSSGKIRKFPLH